MQFCAFELDEESTWLCVVVTPFGKHRCLRLPMGVCNSPDFAQDVVEEIFSDMLNDIDIHIDDIGAFDEDCDLHISRQKFTAPMNERRSETVFGASSSRIASIFFFQGLTPSGVNQCPSQSVS